MDRITPHSPRAMDAPLMVAANAEAVQGPDAAGARAPLNFISSTLEMEAGNALGKRLYQDLQEVGSVACRTRRIFGTEQVGKALRKLRPIEDMPNFPEPLAPSSFTSEVWYKIYNLFTKACLGAPGINENFRTCTSIEGTRSTVLRWAQILSQCKPEVPGLPQVTVGCAGSEADSAGNGAVDSSRLSVMEASREFLASRMPDCIQAQKNLDSVVSTASLHKSKDPEVPIGTNGSRDKEPAVGVKRRRAGSWVQGLGDVVGDVADEEDNSANLGANHGLGADPTGLNPSENMTTKSHLSKSDRNQEWSLLAHRVAKAEAKLGMFIDLESLRAVEYGCLENVHLVNFLSTSSSWFARKAAAVRQGVGASYAKGILKPVTDGKFEFSGRLQFVEALDNFVKVWGVLKPKSHLQSLAKFRDLLVDWLQTEVAPISVLMAIWIEHKRIVGFRRFSRPPFDWLDGDRDIIMLRLKLQAVVKQQYHDKSRERWQVADPPLAGGFHQAASVISRKKAKGLAWAEYMLQRDTSLRLCKYGNQGCWAFKAEGGCSYFHTK